jgi:drug/metabolite transporter (DMT)-like permease
MNRKAKADIYLLITALIWGLAFVAQRVGMEYMGPFFFNALRFALGATALLPMLYLYKRSGNTVSFGKRKLWISGIIAGSFLFVGASLQQIGLVYTTAAKSGFITGLYVVLVPVFGILWKHKTNFATWMGIVLATIGLYLLSFEGDFIVNKGDLLVFLGTFFWANHVLLIAKYSPMYDSLSLSISQFYIVAFFSLIVALFIEPITLNAIQGGLIPVLYGGLISVAIAYTLQVVAQKDAHPAYASIILSLETVFAALGGWLMLGETMNIKGMIGCTLMFIGILVTQVPDIMKLYQSKNNIQ